MLVHPKYTMQGLHLPGYPNNFHIARYKQINFILNLKLGLNFNISMLNKAFLMK